MDLKDAIERLLPDCLLRDQHQIRTELAALQRRGSGRALPSRPLGRLLQRARQSAQVRRQRRESLPTIDYPPDLPIVARRHEIIEAIRQNQVIVVAGETGSGKTTQLPKMCLEAGLGGAGRIGCTQPRRVAALSISRRLAEELHVPWGREVGAKIRFQDRSVAQSVIKLMTDGILLAETQADRDLLEYEVLILDEAHERSLNIDFLLGYLKTLLPRRPELKLVITSATIDTEAFSRAFGEAPVLEVSGRLYPVDIRYAPHDPEAEDRGDLTYIDAAVEAAREILASSGTGDILIFMPGERDIRETLGNLRDRSRTQAELLPMFGRLSAQEQERVFAPAARRKVIVATNIAETSLTLPGIRYVIDPGLVRMSRYSPRSRTRRLPIEPASQSSADQRAGRAGRLQDGVCVRLYSEEEYQARPRFTQPEIQRCNLAEVILRMKAFALGEMESFPFLNPPAPAAIQEGYRLLHELGAIDADRQLTERGRQLARLPVDPSIGRMILQSVEEDAVEEVLVIAAALSIQDPRERPWDRQEEADQAHRKFLHPDSDFLTLANIWQTYHDTWESLRTQNQLRKFCRAHFLSYPRMREWRDIHAQLGDALRDMLPRARRRDGAARSARETTHPHTQALVTPKAAAIHRSILSGLLGHVAQRTGPNQYRACGNREVMVFPGSTLFRRTSSRRSPTRGQSEDASVAGNERDQPEWVVAGERVETQRLYLRTLAGIDPDWLVELADHLCRRTHLEPHWDRKAGRVLARERITFLGLTIRNRWIDFGLVRPDAATDLFVRSALVENDLAAPHAFLQHNRQLHQRLQMWRSRTRGAALPDPDEALFRFYRSQLQGVSSVHDLNRILKAGQRRDPRFLFATEADLVGEAGLGWEEKDFPREVDLAGHTVEVDYAYAPGTDQDGVTLRVPASLAHRLEPSMLDWIIPGLRLDQVTHLIKSLPKPTRRRLMPLAGTAQRLADELGAGDSLEDLRARLEQDHGLRIPPDTLDRRTLPDYLRPRIAIIGPQGDVVAVSRDLDPLKKGLHAHETPAEQEAWQRAAERWERYDLKGWSFGDPPESIEVTEISGTPFLAFPGLQIEGPAVHLKLFRQHPDAVHASAAGWMRLAEKVLDRELAWLRRDLRSMTEAATLYAALGDDEAFEERAYVHLRRHLLWPPGDYWPLRQGRFQGFLEEARTALGTVQGRFAELILEILRLRQQLKISRFRYPGQEADLEALVPARFLAVLPFPRLERLPRYLRAMQIRAERASMNLEKDRQKAGRVQPYLEALSRWHAANLQAPRARQLYEQLYWLVQEFKVSVFAQELGTPEPVSSRRLDQLLQSLQHQAG